MRTMEDLPLLRLPVPPLPRKGRWVDNGPLSNMAQGQATIRYRSVATRLVEPAYVAAKAPDAIVRDAAGLRDVAFHERVAEQDPARAKALGVSRQRGGLVDARPDWERVCIGAMASFLAQKFAAGTREATWLLGREQRDLVVIRTGPTGGGGLPSATGTPSRPAETRSGCSYASRRIA